MTEMVRVQLKFSIFKESELSLQDVSFREAASFVLAEGAAC